MAPSSNDCRSAKLPQGNLRHANRLSKTRVVARNVCMLQLSELAKDGGRDSYGANRRVIRRYCISATLEFRSSNEKKRICHHHAHKTEGKPIEKSINNKRMN